MKNIKPELWILFFLCPGLPFILQAQDRLYPETFPVGDVKLLEGPFKHARDLNIKVLLEYDIDRLLAPYRKEAGLEPKAPGYPNWAGLDGHVGGHYLSAMAMNYAATGNSECRKRMRYMISEIKACQDANAIVYPDWGIGYAGGMPNSEAIWNSVKNGDFGTYRRSWAPWYNIHKMYAGLRDAWLYAGNEEAKTIFLKFCDWGIHLTLELTDAQMQTMLDSEHGGINEMFADAYQLTGDKKYLTAAKRFSHKALLKPMSVGNDNLDNKHANTQIPKVVGFQRIAELANDKDYAKASSYFWHTVTQNRSLVFGGNSRKEHFPSVKACGDFINDVEGPESCNSYNMLKLTEHLFRFNPTVRYMDYYERTLYNHILSIQHPAHGGHVYFTPARPRHYRVYSSPNEAMWCCVGTGMENHGKYNEMIYTRHKDSIYVNLFIASELNWKEKGIKIKQETNFPDQAKTKLTVTGGSARVALMIRYPSWVKDGELKIRVNGKSIPIKSRPSFYFAIERLWRTGDNVQIILPMHHSVEQLPNVPDYIAFLHGPILLCAQTGKEDLAGLVADDSRWGQIPAGKRLPVDKAPILIADDLSRITDKLTPIEDKPLQFKISNLKMVNPQNFVLEPFYNIHDARYMMYWMALTPNQYETRIDSIAVAEKNKLALENRTIDSVAPGQQQPETDHDMKSLNSNSGVFLDEFWRDAKAGGYFSYRLNTNGETDLSLRVHYFGYEWGNRRFDIFIDNEKLLTEDNTGRWYQSVFKDVEYKIPNRMIEGKNNIRVKFKALAESTAGAVYFIRLLKSEHIKN
ncbi:MAG: glycoside hydrolase family 127 protein [candidate division KSB1 bacterium]|nr:glycoside hydrolase family 127 protein [candidate division KSB1 bacterium]